MPKRPKRYSGWFLGLYLRRWLMLVELRQDRFEVVDLLRERIADRPGVPKIQPHGTGPDGRRPRAAEIFPDDESRKAQEELARERASAKKEPQ